MTTPIALMLRDLRLRAGLTQAEMAAAIGYEQAYASSVELGTKGPSQEYLNRLKALLMLDERESHALEMALQSSKRRFVLSPEAPIEAVRFVNDLWEKIDRMHPALLGAMHLMLRVGDEVAKQHRHTPSRLKRRVLKEVQ